MIVLDPLPLSLDECEVLWQPAWSDPDAYVYPDLTTDPCRDCGSTRLRARRDGCLVYYETPEFVARNGHRYRHDGTPLERRYSLIAQRCRDCHLIDVHRYDGLHMWSSDQEED